MKKYKICIITSSYMGLDLAKYALIILNAYLSRFSDDRTHAHRMDLKENTSVFSFVLGYSKSNIVLNTKRKR
jgi:hypothetical protein